MFSFYPKKSRIGSKKNFRDSGVVGHRKVPSPVLSNVFDWFTIYPPLI